MSANVTTAAPTGRKKLAQGEERSDAALGNDSPNTSRSEGTKEDSGWPVTPLGELAADERNAITDGPFGSKLKTDHYTDTGPRVIRLKNIGDAEFVDAKAHISEAHFATLQKHRVFSGDVVIAALGEDPPRACLVPEYLGPAIVKADCIRFKAGPRILPKFINYALNAPDLRRYAKGIVHGVGRPRLNLGEIKALPIPVPPLPEQRRIVAEIEKQFTRLEAGVAALRRVQANLKRYRAAVLKAACEGKLVPTEAELARQRATPNSKLETGEALLRRILTERRHNWLARHSLGEGRQGRGKYKEPTEPDSDIQQEIPEGWTVCSVGQVSECLDGKRVPINKAERAKRHGDIPYYGANGQVGWIDDYLFDEPIVLVVEDETFTGRTQAFSYVIRGKTWVNNHAHVLRATAAVSTGYLNYSLAHYPFTARTTGSTGRRKLTQKALMAAPYLLPPLAEQTRIVAEVEQRLSVVEELESVVTANLKRATRLRQSILQKAFQGQL